MSGRKPFDPEFTAWMAGGQLPHPIFRPEDSNMSLFKRLRARKARPFRKAIAENPDSQISKRLRLRLLQLHIQEATPK